MTSLIQVLPTLSLSSTNIRSLMAKRELLCSFLYDCDCDILALTKTWLYPDVTNDKVLPDRSSFNIYQNDRTNRWGGGVLAVKKKTLQSYANKLHSNMEII